MYIICIKDCEPVVASSLGIEQANLAVPVAATNHFAPNSFMNKIEVSRINNTKNIGKLLCFVPVRLPLYPSAQAIQRTWAKRCDKVS